MRGNQHQTQTTTANASPKKKKITDTRSQQRHVMQTIPRNMKGNMQHERQHVTRKHQTHATRTLTCHTNDNMRSLFTSLEAVGICFEESNLDVDHVCRDRSNQHPRCCRLQQTSTSTIRAQILVRRVLALVIDPQQHFASPSCTKHIRSCHTHLSCHTRVPHLNLYDLVVERQNKTRLFAQATFLDILLHHRQRSDIPTEMLFGCSSFPMTQRGVSLNVHAPSGIKFLPTLGTKLSMTYIATPLIRLYSMNSGHNL